MAIELTFYTKEGCCLCDEAREMLARLSNEFDLAVCEVDITTDPQVFERFKEAIPVVEIDGEAKLGGRFSEDDLRHALSEVEDEAEPQLVVSRPARRRPIAKGGGKRKARGAASFVFRLLAAIIFVSAVFWILDERGVLLSLTGRGDSSIPGAIGGFQLQKTATGQEAIDNLTAMHGTDVGLSDGWIGYYQAGGIVWYGDIVDEASATGLLNRMTSKIAAGNPTFTNLRQFEYGGVQIYSVIGTGQQHFYYQNGKKLIWLAAPRGGEEAFLKDALKVLK